MNATPVAPAQTSTVTIQMFTYSPDPVTVAVGDSIQWINQDDMIHTATADDGTWNTGDISGGTTSAPIIFGRAGTFPYHCIPRPGMKGTVQVG
jgi:plastocyanin